METNLTDEEFKALNESKTLEQWTAAVDAVLHARGNQYPCDWYEKVLEPGVHVRVATRFGNDAKIGVIVGEREVARVGPIGCDSKFPTEP